MRWSSARRRRCGRNLAQWRAASRCAAQCRDDVIQCPFLHFQLIVATASGIVDDGSDHFAKPELIAHQDRNRSRRRFGERGFDGGIDLLLQAVERPVLAGGQPGAIVGAQRVGRGPGFTRAVDVVAKARRHARQQQGGGNNRVWCVPWLHRLLHDGGYPRATAKRDNAGEPPLWC